MRGGAGMGVGLRLVAPSNRRRFALELVAVFPIVSDSVRFKQPTME